ncbi:MAG TPA: aminoglycoside phosphotransferase family protein [Lachnospiraceae bacterium]|nr:aminoglycoside phosphotransferase family protein [Lachnospiraceae bacterium]
MKNQLQVALENLYNTNIKNITITSCGSGDVNSSFIATYGNIKYFVKVQDQPNLPHLYENQIEREVEGITICEAHGIPCPQIEEYNTNEKFIITEYVNSVLLGSVWEKLSDQQRLKIKQQAMELVAKMNTIEAPYFGNICNHGEIKRFSNWTDSYRNIVDIALRDCLDYKSLNKSECAIIRERVEDHCTRLDKTKWSQPVFSHMDFHWNNIFIDIDEMKITKIFDFGSSLYTPKYMAYYRLDGGFLYGTEHFYDKNTICPLEYGVVERECAMLLNTLDYFTFLSYKNRDYQREKNILLYSE